MFQPFERNLTIAICRKPPWTSLSFTLPPLPLCSLLIGGASSVSSPPLLLTAMAEAHGQRRR
jgi:hypothetical protein